MFRHHEKGVETLENEKPRVYLSADAAAEYIALSVPSFWKAVREGRLPAPVYPVPRTPRWVAAEIDAALEATRALPRDQMIKRRNEKAARDRGRET